MALPRPRACGLTTLGSLVYCSPAEAEVWSLRGKGAFTSITCQQVETDCSVG